MSKNPYFSGGLRQLVLWHKGLVLVKMSDQHPENDLEGSVEQLAALVDQERSIDVSVLLRNQ